MFANYGIRPDHNFFNGFADDVNAIEYHLEMVYARGHTNHRPTRMQTHCEKQRRDPTTVQRRIGKLPRQNIHTAKFVDMKVTRTDTGAACTKLL
jgi:hypothetical protein